MHGLGSLRPVRGLILAGNIAGVLAVYGPLGWGRLSEVVRIPLIDYAAVFSLACMIGLMRLLGATAGRVNGLSADCARRGGPGRLHRVPSASGRSV